MIQAEQQVGLTLHSTLRVRGSDGRLPHAAGGARRASARRGGRRRRASSIALHLFYNASHTGERALVAQASHKIDAHGHIVERAVEIQQERLDTDHIVILKSRIGADAGD